MSKNLKKTNFTKKYLNNEPFSLEFIIVDEYKNYSSDEKEQMVDEAFRVFKYNFDSTISKSVKSSFMYTESSVTLNHIKSNKNVKICCQLTENPCEQTFLYYLTNQNNEEFEPIKKSNQIIKVFVFDKKYDDQKIVKKLSGNGDKEQVNDTSLIEKLRNDRKQNQSFIKNDITVENLTTVNMTRNSPSRSDRSIRKMVSSCTLDSITSVKSDVSFESQPKATVTYIKMETRSKSKDTKEKPKENEPSSSSLSSTTTTNIRKTKSKEFNDGVEDKQDGSIELIPSPKKKKKISLDDQQQQQVSTKRAENKVEIEIKQRQRKKSYEDLESDFLFKDLNKDLLKSNVNKSTKQQKNGDMKTEAKNGETTNRNYELRSPLTKKINDNVNNNGNSNSVEDENRQKMLEEHRLKREETEKCLRKVNEYLEKSKKEEQFRKEAQEKLSKLESRAATATNFMIDDKQNRIVDDTIICDTEDDDENENDGLVLVGSKKRPYKVFNYEFIPYDKRIEKNVDKIKDLKDLTPEMINYMVLRDVNYFMDIFTGQCDHSWRHQEYKKTSHKSSKILYSHAALSSFKEEQYVSALNALQSIFSRSHHRYDQYLIKVLLPEALIKICMRIHQCSKDDADNYLRVNSLENPIEFSKRNEHFNISL